MCVSDFLNEKKKPFWAYIIFMSVSECKKSRDEETITIQRDVRLTFYTASLETELKDSPSIF